MSSLELGAEERIVVSWTDAETDFGSGRVCEVSIYYVSLHGTQIVLKILIALRGPAFVISRPLNVPGVGSTLHFRSSISMEERRCTSWPVLDCSH